jgi:hypothetical protein
MLASENTESTNKGVGLGVARKAPYGGNQGTQSISGRKFDMIYLLTAIGSSPGGSTHLHKNNT